MFRLIKSSRYGDNGEKGAISTILAIVLSSGFLFIAFALTSDASALYLERRSLQNSADATSLAVASNCALGSTYCTDAVSAQNEAQLIANSNSPDGISAIKLLCGFTPLSACPAGTTTECKAVPTNLPRYGRVVLSTQNKDGTVKVKSPFFDYFIGNTNSEVNVQSCSQSAWGKANSANIPLPLAITICDYLTEGYKIIRDYSSQLSACPTTIKDVQGITISPQPINVINGWAIFAPNGQPLYCLVPQTITVGNILDTLPPGQERCNDASLSSSDSKKVLASFISANLGKKVFIPVIASTSGTGNGNAQIVTAKTVGFFTFVFLGYDFGPQSRAGCGAVGATCTDFNGQSTTGCGSTRSCIWGKFTKGIVPGASVSRDTTFPPVGASAVELLP